MLLLLNLSMLLGGICHVQEVIFQCWKLLEGPQVKLVVVLWLQRRGGSGSSRGGRMQLVVLVAMRVLSELTHHGCRSFQDHGEIVAVNGLLHVIGVLLHLACGVRQKTLLLGSDLGRIDQHGALGSLWRNRWLWLWLLLTGLLELLLLLLWLTRLLELLLLLLLLWHHSSNLLWTLSHHSILALSKRSWCRSWLCLLLRRMLPHHGSLALSKRSGSRSWLVLCLRLSHLGLLSLCK
mmetsp:Transcript_17084/g.42680  ORF Transcript_17084/g.42680 Transcript_17084/m.42680 type:complete len:236 (+) Transcript_17084:4312-5019(+)